MKRPMTAAASKLLRSFCSCVASHGLLRPSPLLASTDHLPLHDITSGMNPTIDFLPGPELLSDHNQADEVACTLQHCFPEFVGLSTAQTLEEGIGFHSMKDTTWLIFRQSFVNDNGNHKQPAIVGIITAVRYHDGLYLSNFCVVPECRNMGLGLDILEAAGQLAVKMGQNRLIGNARVSDRYIVDYYRSLGAEVIQTGMGGGSNSTSTVRLVREIPETPANVMAFFESLRIQRLQRRRGRKVGCIALGVLLVTTATVGAALLSRRSSNNGATTSAVVAIAWHILKRC